MQIADKKGQAIVEIAVFGSLILFIFGALLSYVQQFNNQQHIQMENFRMSLERACNYKVSTGAGASVQTVSLENRRQSDLSSGFKKGSEQAFSASSSVLWSIPKVGTSGESVMYYKINEDTTEIDYRNFISAAEEGKYELRPEQMETNSGTAFSEKLEKTEDLKNITTARNSSLSENITTTVPYTIRAKDSDDDDDNDVIIRKGTLASETQHLYRDEKDGQYKYSSDVPAGTVVKRGREWTTGF
jgi:hypothetical protein